MNFKNFYEHKENLKLNESLDEICVSILESGLPVEKWFESVFLPTLLESVDSGNFDNLNEFFGNLRNLTPVGYANQIEPEPEQRRDAKGDQRYINAKENLKRAFLRNLDSFTSYMKSVSAKNNNPLTGQMAEILKKNITPAIEKWEPKAFYTGKKTATSSLENPVTTHPLAPRERETAQSWLARHKANRMANTTV